MIRKSVIKELISSLAEAASMLESEREKERERESAKCPSEGSFSKNGGKFSIKLQWQSAFPPKRLSEILKFSRKILKL